MPIGTRNPIISGCGLHHIAIQCHNLEQSLQLYRDVLGMPITLEFTIGCKVALVDIGDGCCIELLGPTFEGPVAEIIPSPFHPLLHIALTTTDTRGSIEIVRQAGYSITMEPKNVDLNGLPVTNAFFRGPDGEIIEFFQVNQYK